MIKKKPLFIDKKIRKKNQISKYYTFSPKKIIKKI